MSDLSKDAQPVASSNARESAGATTAQPTAKPLGADAGKPAVPGAKSAMPKPTTAETGRGPMRVTAHWLRARCAPELAPDNTLGALPHHTTVEAAGRDGDWVKIAYHSKHAFVFGEYVRPLENEHQVAPSSALGADASQEAQDATAALDGQLASIGQTAHPAPHREPPVHGEPAVVPVHHADHVANHAATDSKAAEPSKDKVKAKTKSAGFVRAGGGKVRDVLARLQKAGQLAITANQIVQLDGASQVETDGNVAAVDTTDDMVVSLGFHQVVLGHKSLEAVMLKAPAAFAKHGLALDMSKTYEVAGWSHPHQIQGVEDVDDLRGHEWGDKFYAASLEDAVIVAVAQFALDEAKSVEALTTAKGGTGDYFDDDTARSWLLEVHNNRPAYTGPVVKKAVDGGALSAGDRDGFLDILSGAIVDTYGEQEGLRHYAKQKAKPENSHLSKEADQKLREDAFAKWGPSGRTAGTHIVTKISRHMTLPDLTPSAPTATNAVTSPAPSAPASQHHEDPSHDLAPHAAPAASVPSATAPHPAQLLPTATQAADTVAPHVVLAPPAPVPPSPSHQSTTEPPSSTPSTPSAESTSAATVHPGAAATHSQAAAMPANANDQAYSGRQLDDVDYLKTYHHLDGDGSLYDNPTTPAESALLAGLRHSQKRIDPTYLLAWQTAVGVTDNSGAMNTDTIRKLVEHWGAKQVTVAAIVAGSLFTEMAKQVPGAPIIDLGEGFGGGRRGSTDTVQAGHRADAMARAAGFPNYAAMHSFQNITILGITIGTGQKALADRVALADKWLSARHPLAANNPEYCATNLGWSQRGVGAYSDSAQLVEQTGFVGGAAVGPHMHSAGLALDIDTAVNPYIFAGATNNKNGDANDIMATHLRFAAQIYGGERVTPDGLMQWSKDMSTEELWARVDEVSKSLGQYLELAARGDRNEIYRAFHDAPPSGAGMPEVEARANVQRVLNFGNRNSGFGKRWFQDNLSRTNATGLMAHSMDMVVALRDVAGLAWGGTEMSSVENGDFMHFDLRFDGGVGSAVYQFALNNDREG